MSSSRPPAGYVPCPRGCGRYMHGETRAVCWDCTAPWLCPRDLIHPDWEPPAPKPSALRIWLRAERARENAEDLYEGLLEPYPVGGGLAYRRDWLGVPLGPRSTMGTPIILVARVSTTWQDDAAAVLAAADRGAPIAPLVLATHEKFMAEVFPPAAVPWTEADEVGAVTAYETKR